MEFRDGHVFTFQVWDYSQSRAHPLQPTRLRAARRLAQPPPPALIIQPSPWTEVNHGLVLHCFPPTPSTDSHPSVPWSSLHPGQAKPKRPSVTALEGFPHLSDGDLLSPKPRREGRGGGLSVAPAPKELTLTAWHFQSSTCSGPAPPAARLTLSPGARRVPRVPTGAHRPGARGARRERAANGMAAAQWRAGREREGGRSGGRKPCWSCSPSEGLRARSSPGGCDPAPRGGGGRGRRAARRGRRRPRRAAGRL